MELNREKCKICGHHSWICGSDITRAPHRGKGYLPGKKINPAPSIHLVGCNLVTAAKDEMVFIKGLAEGR